MTTLTITSPTNATASYFSRNKIFIGAYVCNMLEVYDFLITGMMFPYISEIFFPLEDPTSILLAGALTFLVGFLMRPIGAVLFGYIGDIYGRKKALLLSIFGMAIATASIGLLPTYKDIALVAPLLFVLLRLIQGLCMGGEGQGANVFVLEHYRGISPGARGGLLATSNGMAALVAFFISMVATSIYASEESWRICYLFGASLGLVGLYLRSFMQESPAFLQESSKDIERRIPFIEVLRENNLNVLHVFLSVGIATCLTYTGFTFVNLFLSKFLNFSSTFSLSCAAFGTVIGMMVVVLAGRMCDKLGLYKTFNLSLISIILFSFPIHALLASGELTNIIFALFLLAIPTGGICGCLPHLVASSFPTKDRYTGAAFSNNLAQALLGGIQPFLAIYLIKETDVLWSPALYPCVLGCICLIFRVALKNKIKSFEYIAPERSSL